MHLSLILLLLPLLESLAVPLSQNETCSGFPVVPHARVSDKTNKTWYQEGDVIHFTCEIGYVSGPIIKYVCSNKRWIAAHRTKCFLKPCERPDDTPNGYFQITHGEDFVFGTTIKYFCEKGYHMSSKEDSRTCFLEGWSNHLPICEPFSCDQPADENVIVRGLSGNEDPIYPHRTLMFGCGPRKQLKGSSVLICGEDGQWDHPFPSCEDITCTVGAMHDQLYIHDQPPANESVRVGQRLWFSCRDHYVMSGSKEVECLETGEWNRPFPTCIGKCKVSGVPDTVRTTTFIRNNELIEGQKIEFACRYRGHVLRGSAVVECLADGQWSEPFPTCKAPVGCGKAPPLADGDTKYGIKFQHRHNEQVEYVCQNYYVMEGEPFKTCKNGEWIGEMRCLKPCTVNREIMRAHNIDFRFRADDKLYSHHNQEMEFRCVGRTRHDGIVAMRQACVDGVMHLPTCH